MLPFAKQPIISYKRRWRGPTCKFRSIMEPKKSMVHLCKSPGCFATLTFNMADGPVLLGLADENMSENDDKICGWSTNKIGGTPVSTWVIFVINVYSSLCFPRENTNITYISWRKIYSLYRSFAIFTRIRAPVTKFNDARIYSIPIAVVCGLCFTLTGWKLL